jgi:class 3 adenylate cyclase
MNCNGCGRANRTGARFCGGCGRPLAPRCPACAHDCEPDAQFCDACGASLVARPAEDAGARKIVTIVFADLIGSTALHERLDAESARALMDRYYRALHAVVEAHGGRVVKLLGDGVMAAFGLPRVAEDDALTEATEARAYMPWVHVERAELARVVGDEVGCERELREAHRFFTAMGATARTDEVAKETAR